MPYRHMKANNPLLEKCPLLYPFYLVKRWFRFAKKRVRKQAMQELNYSKSASQEKADRLASMCAQLHLRSE